MLGGRMECVLDAPGRSRRFVQRRVPNGSDTHASRLVQVAWTFLNIALCFDQTTWPATRSRLPALPGFYPLTDLQPPSESPPDTMLTEPSLASP